MKIIDFKLYSKGLSNTSYVLVENNSKNINILKRMGCDSQDLLNMQTDDIRFLDVYFVLKSKGYEFSHQKGFYKKEEYNNNIVDTKEFFQTLQIKVEDTQKSVYELEEDLINLLENHGYSVVGAIDTTEIVYSDKVNPIKSTQLAYKKHIDFMKEFWDYEIAPRVFKIWNQDSLNAENKAVYLLSNMSVSQIEDVVSSFSYYMKKNTKFGITSLLTEDIIATLLCECYECKIIDKNEIFNYENYDIEINDVDEEYHINLHWVKQYRLDSSQKETIDKIINIDSSEYMQKLLLYFNDDAAFYSKNDGIKQVLSAKEIMEKY